MLESKISAVRQNAVTCHLSLDRTYQHVIQLLLDRQECLQDIGNWKFYFIKFFQKGSQTWFISTWSVYDAIVPED